LDGAGQALSALPAVAEDLVVLHAGEGVFHSGPHPAMLRTRPQAVGRRRAEFRNAPNSPVI
jgi:hypothetical protein